MLLAYYPAVAAALPDAKQDSYASSFSTDSHPVVTDYAAMPVGTGVYYSREQQVGLVYETFTFVNGQQSRPSVSVLLGDGRDLGGLSAEEAAQELVPLGPTGLGYQFTNVGQLRHDYAAGLFAEALRNAHEQYLAQAPRNLRRPDEAWR